MKNIYCGECGTKAQPDEKTCKKCGKQLPTQKTTVTPSVNKTKESSQIKPTTSEAQKKQKKLLTDRVIKEHIKAHTSFLLLIVLLIASVVSILLSTTIHPGLLIIGFLCIIGAIFKALETVKKIKQRSDYTLILRECAHKEISETDDNTYYNLYFYSFRGAVGWLAVSVDKSFYEKTNIGDYFFLAVKRCKNSTYDIAAYFKETEWRLD